MLKTNGDANVVRQSGETGMIKQRKNSLGPKGTKRGAAKTKPIVAANGDRIRLRWLKPNDEERVIYRSVDGVTYKPVRPARPRRRRKRRKN
jgi:hypothetical protein